MNRRGWTKMQVAVAIALALVACLLIVPCGGPVFPFEFVLYMAFGWILYLYRVSSELRPDVASIATGLVALAIFTGGLHAFCRWLHAARTLPAETTQSHSHWKIRWTLSAVTILLMLFVAGIAMVGITHQIAWMGTADDPIIANSGGAARRMQSQNNLKQLGIAVHLYHDEHDTFPPGMLVGKQGEALHGWQTLILPFFEQQTLYVRIDIERPWNDLANEEQFAHQIKSLLNPGIARSGQSADGPLSHYAANQHVIGGTRSFTLDEITDGTANTLLIGEAAGNCKPWGHPRNWRDPMIGLNTSPDGFGGPWPGGATQFAMADGSVKNLRDDIDPKVLRALATPAGKENISGENWGRIISSGY